MAKRSLSPGYHDNYLILSGEADVVREGPDGVRHTVARRGAGEFFGEMALAWRQPRNAHVIAVSGVTCLVLSAAAPTTFAGRGSGAQLSPLREAAPPLAAPQSLATTCIDVSEFVGQKMAALASRRTQYPIPPDIFPGEMLVKMFGYEYFKRIDPPMELETDLCPTHIRLYSAASGSTMS